MIDLKLVFPTAEAEAKAIGFKEEFFNNGEKIINGSNRLDMDKYSYSQWLEIIGNLNINTDKSEFSHTFFAVICDEIVGIVNVRHPLIGVFENSGNIGYSVRPSERRKGCATRILSQILPYCAEMGLDEVFLVCEKNNEASVKTIEKNGGKINRIFSKNNKEYCEFVIRK